MKFFNEKQKITQTWLLILLVISVAIPLFVITNKYINNKITLKSYFITLIVVITSASLVFLFNLKTKIDEYGIHYQFFPIHLKFKTFYWNDIKKVEVIKYNPLVDFGGWGVRYTFSKKKGITYNVSGNIGIQIELKNGKKRLIGTQKKHEATRVLNNYKHKINSAA